MTWQELEDFTLELLKNDHPKKPTNSGATKGEEDVVGNNIVAQCKYTSDKNMSILSKDLERLLTAAKIQEKFPLFITSNDKSTILSLPINKETEEIINFLVNIILSVHSIDSIDSNIPYLTTGDRISRAQIREQHASNIFEQTSAAIKDKFKKVGDKIKTKLDNLLMYNLFGD